MRKLIVFLLFVSTSSIVMSQNKPAYKIYNAKGSKVSYKKMLKKMEKADVVLFGEHHNNPIIHWLQLEATVELHLKRDLTLGAEMFEADDQMIINEYLSGKYDYKTFAKEMKLWPNNKTDYQPLMDYALKYQLGFIATNIPRRYANTNQ